MTETPDDDLAADYVLGLTAPEVLSDVERRVATDPAFARTVERWRTDLSAFDDSAPEEAPARDAWPRLEQELLAQQPSQGAPTRAWPWRLWSDIGALRIAAVSAAALAFVFAGLAATLFTTGRNAAARKPVFVAVLVSDGAKQAGAVVNAFADGSVELVPLVDIDVPNGRALQIWTLWDRAVGPRSVALIDHARTIRLDLDRLPTTGADQLFEITLEPTAGSPLSRPTGPILFKGTTSRAL